MQSCVTEAKKIESVDKEMKPCATETKVVENVKIDIKPKKTFKFKTLPLEKDSKSESFIERPIVEKPIVENIISKPNVSPKHYASTETPDWFTKSPADDKPKSVATSETTNCNEIGKNIVKDNVSDPNDNPELSEEDMIHAEFAASIESYNAASTETQNGNEINDGNASNDDEEAVNSAWFQQMMSSRDNHEQENEESTSNSNRVETDANPEDNSVDGQNEEQLDYESNGEDEVNEDSDGNDGNDEPKNENEDKPSVIPAANPLDWFEEMMCSGSFKEPPKKPVEPEEPVDPEEVDVVKDKEGQEIRRAPFADNGIYPKNYYNV